VAQGYPGICVVEKKMDSLSGNEIPVSQSRHQPRYRPSDKGLMKVKDTQNYWVSGLRSSSGILKAREHDVSETGSVSVLR
jgi:hypothetical protein